MEREEKKKKKKKELLSSAFRSSSIRFDYTRLGHFEEGEDVIALDLYREA